MTAASMAAMLGVLLLASCGDDGLQTPTSPTVAPDTANLSITCPAPVVTATTSSTATVSYPLPTTSGGIAPIRVTCSPFSGSSFPLGTTSVGCQALDAQNTAAACSFSVLVTKVPTLSKTRFLAFGDSTTSGEISVPVPTTSWEEGGPWERLVLVPSASYPTQLLRLLTTRYATQASVIQVFNSGHSGEPASDGSARFPAAMDSLRPSAVLLLEGYNDLNLYGSRGISAGISGLESMAREARSRGARVFLASLTPSRPGGRNTIDPLLVAEFNSRVRTLATGEGAVFVDLHAALLPGLSTYIGSDGLHPTEAGYQRMADEFFSAIRANLEEP